MIGDENKTLSLLAADYVSAVERGPMPTDTLALHASAAGVWEWDLRTGSVTVTERFKKILGYELGDPGWDGPWNDLFDRIHPEDVGEVLADLQTHLDGVWPFECRCRMTTGRGDIRWFRLTGQAEWGEDEKVTRVAGTISDVTEDQAIEEKLRDSEKRFRRLFDALPLGLAVTGNDFVVTICNDAFRETCRTEELSFLDEPLRVSLRETGSYGPAERMLDLGIEPLPVEIRGFALDSKQSLHIVEDISERKEAEEHHHLLQRQCLNLGRMSGMAEMATGVLHNIGNVLNSLMVSVDMLRENQRTSAMVRLEKLLALIDEHEDPREFFISDPRAARLPQFMKAILMRAAGERAHSEGELDRIQDLLAHLQTIVNAQQGIAKGGHQTEDVRPKDLLGDVLLMAHTSVSLYGLDIVQHDSTIQRYEVQRHKVLQILLNLVVNAVHAIHDTDVSEPRIILRSSESGPWLVLEVVDNGCGMSHKSLGRLFEYGFTTKMDGHGFGLHNCAALAQGMGGELSAKSDGPGKGSTFCLRLPREQVAPE